LKLCVIKIFLQHLKWSTRQQIDIWFCIR
jgi:hypothetical protein